jgi:hypothetical protein
MPLVRDLRAEVFEWIDRNQDRDSRIGPFMHPMKNWPEFPEGKFRAGLDFVDKAQGFEELLIDLQRAEDVYPVTVQTGQVLRRACMRLIWEKQAGFTVTEPYKNFARQVESSRGVVSFNWDLICESAVDELGIAWLYDPAFRRPILKPHGSINWVNHLQGREGREIQTPPGLSPISPEMTISWEPTRPFQDPLFMYDQDDFRQVLFPSDPEMPSKEDGAARRDAVQLWRAVERLLLRAEEIVFIGYSLPAYDQYASKVLGRVCTGKRLIICNPERETTDRFRQTFATSEISPDPVCFEDSRYAKPLL